MKNSKIRHWVFFILLIVGYVGLELVEEVDGIWKWLALGLAIAVFIGEAYFAFKGRDGKSYFLKSRKQKEETKPTN